MNQSGFHGMSLVGFESVAQMMVEDLQWFMKLSPHSWVSIHPRKLTWIPKIAIICVRKEIHFKIHRFLVSTLNFGG